MLWQAASIRRFDNLSLKKNLEGSNLPFKATYVTDFCMPFRLNIGLSERIFGFCCAMFCQFQYMGFVNLIPCKENLLNVKENL